MRRTLVALPITVLLFTAACSSSGSPAKSSAPGSAGGSQSAVKGSITVFAASSLTEAFTTIKKDVEAKYPGTTITLDFGASSDLSTQINEGKAGDVFASASTKNMTAVVKAGNAKGPQDFVANTLEIAVPPGNPAKITRLSNLARSGVKVAVCDAAVPCGTVAAKVFANAHVTVKPVTRPEDVKSTLAVVESGEVDAGLVYVTDVRAAGAKVRGVQIPGNVNASTTYPIAPLTKAGNPGLAAAFVAYVLSPAGQQVLTSDGFTRP